MKTLYLLRHAKSDWSDFSVRDHDRPLNDRGRLASKGIGAYLGRNGIAPDLVLCSTAVRTRETLERVANTARAQWHHRFEPRIYEASTRALYDLVKEQDDTFRSLMIIGHNPGLHDFAITLAQGGDPDALENLNMKLPTGTFLTLSLECESFRDIAPKCARLDAFIRPKSLPED